MKEYDMDYGMGGKKSPESGSGKDNFRGDEGTGKTRSEVYGSQMSDPYLEGGNDPHKKTSSEDFGNSEGGSVHKGLACHKPITEEPEYLGMGTCGPNQLPCGPAMGPAARGHHFG